MTVKPWEIRASRSDASFRVFSLRTDRACSPRTGKVHDFYILETAPWVNVIPITADRKVVLVRQYRHGTRRVTLEIPGGLVDPGDTPLQAAKRELLEETGFCARQWLPLGWVHPNPAIQDNRCHTFLARDAVPAGRQQQDEKEDIDVVLHPLQEIPRLIRTGAITHALVLAAFYRLFLEHPEQASLPAS